MLHNPTSKIKRIEGVLPPLKIVSVPNEKLGKFVTSIAEESSRITDAYALTLNVVAGMDKQAIERLFHQRIDNQEALVLQKLNGGGLRALTVEDRMDWARFLMSLRIRQPNIVQMLRSQAEQHLRATLAKQPEQYEELLGLKNPPTLIEWTEKCYPGFIENCGMSFFRELVDNPAIGAKVLRMKWWIWDLSNLSYDLLLADHPCIFTSRIDDPSLVIALPISPTKVFMATQSENIAEIMLRQQPKEFAKRVNESSINQGRVRLYARDKSPARFIQKRLGANLRKRAETERNSMPDLSS